MEDVNVHKQSTNIGKKFFELRDYTPVPLIIILFFVAEPTVLTATLGMLLIMAGELFRIYSVAFIGTVSRTRSNSNGSNLITGGPFAWVRNPLYLGNLSIVIGITVYGGISWLVMLTAILFVVQYSFIVQYEEDKLVKKFGDEYEEYRRTVPAWIPHKFPGLAKMEWPSEMSSALKSEKRTLTAIALIVAALALLST